MFSPVKVLFRVVSFCGGRVLGGSLRLPLGWAGGARLLQPSFPPGTTPWILEVGGVGPLTSADLHRMGTGGTEWTGGGAVASFPGPRARKSGFFSRGAWERG